MQGPHRRLVPSPCGTIRERDVFREGEEEGAEEGGVDSRWEGFQDESWGGEGCEGGVRSVDGGECACNLEKDDEIVGKVFWGVVPRLGDVFSFCLLFIM